MDRTAGKSLRSVMARRNVYDPLEPTGEPRWYIVRGGQNVLLEVRPLPAGTDLKRVFVAAMLERIDAGWQLGEFSSRGGSVFFTRGIEPPLRAGQPAARPRRSHQTGHQALPPIPVTSLFLGEGAAIW
jgi:hypothetical protein